MGGQKTTTDYDTKLIYNIKLDSVFITGNRLYEGYEYMASLFSLHSKSKVVRGKKEGYIGSHCHQTLESAIEHLDDIAENIMEHRKRFVIFELFNPKVYARDSTEWLFLQEDFHLTEDNHKIHYPEDYAKGGEQMLLL